jgi:hypothetical protein
MMGTNIAVNIFILIDICLWSITSSSKAPLIPALSIQEDSRIYAISSRINLKKVALSGYIETERTSVVFG